jgi:hypothetical protein
VVRLRRSDAAAYLDGADSGREEVRIKHLSDHLREGGDRDG